MFKLAVFGLRLYIKEVEAHILQQVICFRRSEQLRSFKSIFDTFFPKVFVCLLLGLFIYLFILLNKAVCWHSGFHAHPKFGGPSNILLPEGAVYISMIRLTILPFLQVIEEIESFPQTRQ